MIKEDTVSRTVARAHSEASDSLPFANTRDFENVARGLIASHDDTPIKNDQGQVIWDFTTLDFMHGEAPASVHPSLWRLGILNSNQGLFEVVEGIYQVRGFDLANVTFIETDNGVVVVDPLTAIETAQAAFAMYRKHRGERAVKAVIYTHSHADHFGGVKSIITQEQADSGEVLVIAPAGFTEHAVAENVYAGTAMSRRAAYMYGAALAPGIFGQVGTGLAQAVAPGTLTLIVPTVDITETGQTLTIDGGRL
jgi:alkyl sulfatase BDS1-like metallo-beta-lactamase superfamily hydrolase